MCLPMYSQFREATIGWRRYDFDYNRDIKEIGIDLNFTETNLTYADFEINGRHCKSGLAYKKGREAVCEDALFIKQGDRELTGETNYECDPYNNDNPCKIYYNSTDFFTVPCKCALDGEKGYCASILGTK